MPIYEYQCEKCASIFEVIVSMHANDKPTCRSCGSDRTRKILSTTGIRASSDKPGKSDCRSRGGFA